MPDAARYRREQERRRQQHEGRTDSEAAALVATGRTGQSRVPAPISDRPLNTTQMNSLRKIVQGDFANLEAEVKAEIQRRLRRRKEELETEYGRSEGWQSWEERWKDLYEGFQVQVSALAKETADAGFQPKTLPVYVESRKSWNGENWQRPGLSEAVMKVSDAANSMSNLVTSICARELRAVERVILVMSLPGAPGADDVLRDLPRADEMFEKITTELAERDPDLVAALMDIPTTDVPVPAR